MPAIFRPSMVIEIMGYLPDAERRIEFVLRTTVRNTNVEGSNIQAKVTCGSPPQYIVELLLLFFGAVRTRCEHVVRITNACSTYETVLKSGSHPLLRA